MRIVFAALAAFFVLTAAVLADPAVTTIAPTNVVSVPWGDWVTSFLTLANVQQALGALLLAAALALVGMLPAWVQEFVRPLILTWRTNQLFEKQASAAIAGVSGAVAGKTASVSVTNEIVRTMLLMVVQRGAPVVLDFAGREARALAEKALARLGDRGIVPPEYTIADATAQADEVLLATGDGTA